VDAASLSHLAQHAASGYCVEMTRLVSGDGRTHIQSRLMRESLQDRGVISQTDSDRDLQVFPDVTLVSIGGQSIFDRGKDAILPLVDELIELKRDRSLKMVLGVGGGTRVRHTISIAVDLGLPVGGMAQLAGAMEELNAILLNTLLAPHGSMPMQRDHFWDLPLYFDAGITPIAISVPPYHFWEPPPDAGHLPMHGSDFGLFQLAEVLGMKQVIYVKDEDGLYDRDPKKHAGAIRFSKITLDELMRQLPEDNILDRELFHAWTQAKNLRRITIVNGLVRGQLTRAMHGEDVGTVIVKDAAGEPTSEAT
jgi:molybdenum storage protein